MDKLTDFSIVVEIGNGTARRARVNHHNREKIFPEITAGSLTAIPFCGNQRVALVRLVGCLNSLSLVQGARTVLVIVFCAFRECRR
jgi:hypothetical protein